MKKVMKIMAILLVAVLLMSTFSVYATITGAEQVEATTTSTTITDGIDGSGPQKLIESTANTLGWDGTILGIPVLLFTVIIILAIILTFTISIYILVLKQDKVLNERLDRIEEKNEKKKIEKKKE